MGTISVNIQREKCWFSEAKILLYARFVPIEVRAIVFPSFSVTHL